MFKKRFVAFLLIWLGMFPVPSFGEEPPVPSLEEEPPVLSFAEDPPKPPPPNNFSAISGEIQAVPLTWSMHSNTKVTGYVIYLSGSEDGEFKEIAKLPSRYIISYLDGKDVANTTFKILSKLRGPLLSNDKSYYYKIAAIIDKDIISEFSKIIKATTAPIPSPPLNFRAFGGGAKVISLNWLPPKDKTVTGYRIYRKNSEDEELLSIKDISGRLTLSYIDGNRPGKPLEDGKEYYYAISSLNQGSAESYITKIVSAQTKNVPPTIEGISASKGKVKSIEVTWNPSPIPDLKHYSILKERIDSHETRKVIKIPADTTMYLDENLPDGARYHYKVKAVDIDKLEGIPSLEASGITKSIPETPKNIKIYMDEEKLVVKWDKNQEPDIVKYEVYKMTGFIGIMNKLGVTKNPSFVDREVKKGERVSYKITAVDADDLKSKKSDTITIQVPER